MTEVAGITDYERAIGVCGWCWRSTPLVFEDVFTRRSGPLHLTCYLQMRSVWKRLERGETITGRTLAERRYLRMIRVLKRHAEEMRVFAARTPYAELPDGTPRV